MSDPRSLETLHRIVRRESSSLLQYMAGAFPWTTALRTETLARLESIILAERGALIGLTRYLYRHKISPRPGGYPTDFTSLNFIDLHHLVPLLIARQKENIAQLESDVRSLTDPEARRLAESYLALKKQHLEALQNLNTPEPAVMS